MSVYVTNLSGEMKEKELQQIFSKYGEDYMKFSDLDVTTARMLLKTYLGLTQVSQKNVNWHIYFN